MKILYFVLRKEPRQENSHKRISPEAYSFSDCSLFSMLTLHSIQGVQVVFAAQISTCKYAPLYFILAYLSNKSSKSSKSYSSCFVASFKPPKM